MGLSTTHLIIFLIIIFVIFGTKKLRNIGADLGGAVKGFKDGMRDGNEKPASRLLVSADALWERGFGVVFPELEGFDAFDAVAQTIDLIEALAPAQVIPGHGAVFSGVTEAIARARERLAGFVASPEKHIRHAAKVLLKFKLLEMQTQEFASFVAWAQNTPDFALIAQRHFAGADFAQWIDALIEDLIRAGAAAREGSLIRNVG